MSCMPVRERDFDAAFAALVQLASRRARDRPRSLLHQPARTARRADGSPRGARDLPLSRVCGGRRPDELRGQSLRMRIVWSASTPAGFSRARSRPTCRSSSPTKFELIINLKTAKALGLTCRRPPRPRRRGDRMRRREFITLLGGAAAAWPLVAHAQQRERMRRIGVLMSRPRTIRMQASSRRSCRRCRNGLDRRPQCRDRLSLGGGRYRAHSQHRGRTGRARARRHPGARQLDRGRLEQATRTVPIVFANVTDPVGAGFVDSLARPGGNATGFTRSNTA